MELPKAYEPKQVETRIYNLWLKSGFFNPDKLPRLNKKAYCIVIPPPNITGELHMGHALNTIVQDILIREKRLEGFRALWLPGTDHAGIATQNVVEKGLKREGKTRFDLGREKFIERVWAWREKYGNIILDQLKKLGASCDWSRTRFTLDKDYVKAVETAFSSYYKKGWVYKGKRVVNWCPRCATSLSDLELEYKEEKSHLWYIKYPPFITVATTRPETMLGDTAVAVNPNDKRYKHLIGKEVTLPLVNKKIPIIADRAVDPEFGTGAVKVTPAHDVADYEIGLRHNLEVIQIIDEAAKITKAAPLPYQGLKVLEARQKVVEDLKKLGLLKKTEDYSHQVPKCYRCQTIVELILSEQWFLKMEELAKLAIKAVKSGKVRFIPTSFEKLYFDWLENIKDWCISRQLWWGHRIPVWHCGDPKNTPKHKMGFHKDVVFQVLKGKTKTYRLRNHDFQVGDKVLFENSQTKTYFGYGIITSAAEMKIEEIDYRDKAHYKTYRNLKELIAALKLRNPDRKVTPKSRAYLYGYKFHPFSKENAKKGCGQTIISIRKPKRCPACKGTSLHQGHDVLDTWFSSALWPFAALGWPNKTKGLNNFYPTMVLSTDRGIINLWVARMIFSGLYFIKKIPFHDVYIHATVLTREGRRMSKSLGTGIDPLNLVEKYGADATRFGIAYQIMGGQDIKFVEDNIVMGRKFCNKLWNASRFVIMKTKNSKLETQNYNRPYGKQAIKLEIIKKLNKTVKSVNKDLEYFQFGKAAHTLYDFFWHDFCDRYIEESKEKNDEKTKATLLFTLLTSLKLLHPFVPFITEEIYQKLPIKNKKRCLMIEEWPK